MEEFMENKFSSWSAHEITQYLRGELFVFADFLLGGSHTITEDQVVEIEEFFKTFIRFTVVWLQTATDLSPKVSA